MASFTPAYGKVDRDYGMRLATTPPEEDGPVWMLNLMKYRDVAAYADGNPEGISGKEADDRYAPTEVLRKIGAHVPFFGDVESQPVGSDVAWDRIGMVKYPTRRSFIDMQARSDFKGKHEHKEAGMEFTFVMGCQPIDFGASTAAETVAASFVVLDVLRFVDGTSAVEMHENARAARDHASAGGGFPLTWFDVEGTIMGDGRKWDAARFTAYPSFDAAVAAPPSHAAPAPPVQDQYRVIVRASINTL